MSAPSPPARPLRDFGVYNAARLGLFGLFAGIFYLGGFRGFLLLLLALAFSGVVSWFALAPLRIRVTRGIEGGMIGMRARMAARTVAEDRAAAELAAAQGPGNEAGSAPAEGGPAAEALPAGGGPAPAPASEG